jgi:hypothetical protein
MKTRSTLSVSIFFLLFGYFFSCNNISKNRSQPEEALNGETLAQQNCSSCHQYVQPEFLPKSYWTEVLSKMAMHFGINDGSDPKMLNTSEALLLLDSATIFPKNPTLTLKEWEAIKNFIMSKAPEKLDHGQRPQINFEMTQFTPKPIQLENNQQIPSLIKILGFNKIALGLSQSAEQHDFSIIDLQGKVKEKIYVPSPITGLTQLGNKLYLTLMGPFAADDNPLGKIIAVETNKDFHFKGPFVTELNNRERPIQTSIADFDKDGRKDLIIAEFGKYLGGLNLYLRNKQNDFTKKTIYKGPGSISTIIKDVNNDGLPDIYALISQGKEVINLYLNKGNGSFEEKTVLSFPPYYGSSHFDIVDFDKDGKNDIIYSNGDSGDFGMPPKPFHGIRFYKNYGNNSFKEEWFYPQQGTYKTIVKDFNQDGDLDIASIGFFAIATLPQESFLYLENQGNIKGKHNFKTYSFLEAVNNSYIVMDAEDIDNDGDIDLVLGSSMTLLSNSEKQRQFMKWKNQGGMIMILENTLK